MNKRKEYLIELFIKKSTLYNSIKTTLNKTFELFSNTYPNIQEKSIIELKEDFNVDNYVKYLSPIIDKYFTEKEIEEIIKFYSSSPGKKTIDSSFLKEVSQLSKSFSLEIEQKFSIENAKYI